MKLNPQGVFGVVAYIDASFSTHQDRKLHSVVIMIVGGAPFYLSLKKQKCVSKSPTEAELVGLLENVEVAELLQELLDF